MKIGELSKLTDLAPSRIRFYEQVGLLQTVTRTANGYRSYPPEAITMLKLITTAQQAGFSLDELRALLPSEMSDWDHRSLLEGMQQKVRDIEEIQARLEQNKSLLLELLAEIAAKPDDMDCADNAKRVLSQYGLSQTSPSDQANTEKK